MGEKINVDKDIKLAETMPAKFYKYKNNSIRVKFEDVKNESEAMELVNYEIFLPIDELPILEGKKFYYHEVIGFKVIDVIQGEVGEITYINDQTPQHLFVVKSNGNEILIPINDDFILDLDRINKIINLKIPEGLLKIYK